MRRKSHPGGLGAQQTMSHFLSAGANSAGGIPFTGTSTVHILAG